MAGGHRDEPRSGFIASLSAARAGRGAPRSESAGPRAIISVLVRRHRGPPRQARSHRDFKSRVARRAPLSGALCISKSGGNYLIIICNYLDYLKPRKLFDYFLLII